MLSSLLQWNSCLGFGGMVQRALKGAYSKITWTGLYSSDRDHGECAASTYLLMMWYEPVLRGKWGGVSVADMEKKYIFKQEVLIAASVPG